MKKILGWLFLQGMVSIAFAGSDVVVRGAWIRAAPPNAPVLAGYMTIENRSPRIKSLIGTTSPAFANVMIHRTDYIAGVAHMSHASAVDIAAKGKLVFQPDGYHLMLMQPKRSLRVGDRIPIELNFSDGARISVVFPVREQVEASKDGGSPHAHHPAPSAPTSR